MGAAEALARACSVGSQDSDTTFALAAAANSPSPCTSASAGGCNGRCSAVCACPCSSPARSVPASGRPALTACPRRLAAVLALHKLQAATAESATSTIDACAASSHGHCEALLDDEGPLAGESGMARVRGWHAAAGPVVAAGASALWLPATLLPRVNPCYPARCRGGRPAPGAGATDLAGRAGGGQQQHGGGTCPRWVLLGQGRLADVRWLCAGTAVAGARDHTPAVLPL